MTNPTEPPRKAGVGVDPATDPPCGLPADHPPDGKDDSQIPSPAIGPGELGQIGHYRILRRLGEGGMGAVFLAEDTRLSRRVALKCILPQYAADPIARERFIREARAAAKIKHDHVVTIYDVGQDGDRPFIAMELLSGLPLDAYLQKKGVPPIPHVLRIGREVALGMAAVHENGLVHRDIKPANVWLEAPAGRVKLLDFGLARVAGDTTRLTGTGSVMGTPAYMSPEQANGEPLAQRSDLFSLGGVLYRLATGRQPFNGPTTIAVLLAVVTDAQAPARTLNPDLPQALSDLIDRLLAKNPAGRPASARAVAEELRAIERALHAPPALALAVPAAPTPASDTAPPRRRARRAKSRRAKSPRRWVLAGVGAALLLAAGAVGLKLATGGRRPTPDEGLTAADAGRTSVAAEQSGLVRTFPGHEESIRGVAFLDARRAVSVSWDHTIRGWDVTADAPGNLWRRQRSLVTSLAVSGDGKRVATGGSAFEVKVWDTATERELYPEFKATRPAVGPLALDDTGTLLLIGDGTDTVELWDVAKRLKRKSFKGPAVVSAVRFLPGGKSFLTGGAGDKAAGDKAPVVLFDIDSDVPVRRFDGHEHNVYGLAPLPDGRRFASCGAEGTVRVWALADGRQLARLSDPAGGKSAAYTALAVTPDGRRAVTGGYDGVLRVWDLDRGTVQTRFSSDPLKWCMNHVALSPDGRTVLTGGGGRAESGKGWVRDNDNQLRLWRLPAAE